MTPKGRSTHESAVIETLAAGLQQYLVHRYPHALLSDFQFVTRGWETDVYSFLLHRPAEKPRPLILRLYPNEEAVPKLLQESAGLRRLQQAGYPVPKILLQETEIAALGKPFTLMEKLQGWALWPVLADAAPAEANDLLDRFGGLIARLHQLDWRPFTERAALYQSDPSVLLEELTAELRPLYTRLNLAEFLAVTDWLDSHRAKIAAQPAVVHLDFHANNVFMCDDGHWAVIDWTQITVSDYRADLSWTLMLMGEFGQPHWDERILQAYRHAFGRPVADLEYFSVFSSAKLLGGALLSLQAERAGVELREGTIEAVREQAPTLGRLMNRLQEITGLEFPETEAALDRVR